MLFNPERRETVSILVDQACVSGGNFLTSLVLARVLLPSAYGRFSLFLLFLYAINTCHSSLIVYPLILRAANRTSTGLATVTLSSLIQSMILAIPLAAICIAFSFLTGEGHLAIMLILAMTAWQLQETARRALLASQNASKAILPDLLCFVGQGILLLIVKPQSLGAILGVIVVTSCVALLWQGLILRLFDASLSKASVIEDAQSAWTRGRHILGGNAFNMVALQLPSWTLALFGGPIAVAGYQALLNLVGIANPVIFSVNTALIPAVARNAAQGYVAARKTALRMGLQYGSLLLPCFIALAVMPSFVMAHVYGKATPYLYLATLLPLFIAAYAIQYVATVIGAYEGGMSRPQSYFKVQAVSTVALAALAVPLVRLHGICGAVIAVLGFSIFRLVSFAWLSYRLDRNALRSSATPLRTGIPPTLSMDVAVCVLTYKRPGLLRKTLRSLETQSVLYNGKCVMRVVVVDNDAALSARTVVQESAERSAFHVSYVSNVANGLSTGRNIALAHAGSAQYVAFIDDDEVASPEWMEHLLATAKRSDASVVTGPVHPVVDAEEPWIVDGGFFAANQHPTDEAVPHVATNNTLLRRDVVAGFRFDTHFDTTGGEDTDFFLRVRSAGHRMVWCNEAVVHEYIPASRANERWILDRAKSDANRFTRAYLRSYTGQRHKLVRVLKAFGGVGLGVMTLPLGVTGRHRRVISFRYFARAAGTFTALRGKSREDYAAQSATLHKVKMPVVVVGQTPPPLNGQTIMIREFVQGTYDDIAITYVPMRFSRSNGEIGRLDWRKPFLLLSIVVSIYRARWKSGARVLYYPPAGANVVPVVRDLLLLSACRPLFEKTVFHFHAAGLSKIYPKLPWMLKRLFRHAYGTPDLAIFTTRATSAEAVFLKARHTRIVPCGAPDPRHIGPPGSQTDADVVTILFAGIVCEGKGIMTLLEACTLLKHRGARFLVKVMGEFQTKAFEAQVKEYVIANGLQLDVVFLGVLSGEDKDEAFRNACMFCFPSHYPAESFGVVLIEAMSHGMPIVATDWQGIPEVTDRSGQGSILVAVRNAELLAGALDTLIHSQQRRQQMGEYNRQRYLATFTLERYRSGLASCIAELA